MSVVYALVVWFGIANSQSSFAISGISDLGECRRLAEEMRSRYHSADLRCFQYRAKT